MRTFIDGDGMEHTVAAHSTLGTCNHVMVTLTKGEFDMIHPQIWESNHNQFKDEVPIWIMRKENSEVTLADILIDFCVAPVGSINDFNWIQMEYKS